MATQLDRAPSRRTVAHGSDGNLLNADPVLGTCNESSPSAACTMSQRALPKLTTRASSGWLGITERDTKHKTSLCRMVSDLDSAWLEIEMVCTSVWAGHTENAHWPDEPTILWLY
jgi:hypothetical protein